eukprot:4112593-Amphidinium_carterae.1
MGQLMVKVRDCISNMPGGAKERLAARPTQITASNAATGCLNSGCSVPPVAGLRHITGFGVPPLAIFGKKCAI